MIVFRARGEAASKVIHKRGRVGCRIDRVVYFFYTVVSLLTGIAL